MEEIYKAIAPVSQVLNEYRGIASHQAIQYHKLFLSNPYYAQGFEYLSLGLEFVQNYDYESVEWKNVVSVVVAVIFVWELFLELRQRIRLSSKAFPPQLKGVISKETFEKSNKYNAAKVSFKMFSLIYSQAVLQIVFHFDILPRIWEFSGLYLPQGYKTELFQSLVFFYVAFVLNSLTSIPINLYAQFVIEAKFGFNKQTIGTFVGDIFKTYFLVLILGVPFFAGFLKIVQWAGDSFVLYLYSFVFVFQIFFLLIFPTFIQPLFNKFTPLEEGSLRNKINDLAAKLKFPLTKIFVVDGSRRSSHSNAYFFGFGRNKRIVLFDTLIEKAGEEEIVAVLAHELSHWYYNHVFWNLIVAQVHFLCMFYTFSFTLGLNSVFQEFGFSEKPIVVGFLLFTVLSC
jgi:STE24 endopeptidase